MAPKYVPEEIWNVQRKRNNTKLMVLGLPDPAVRPDDRRGRAIDLPPESRANFLGRNALAVFGEPLA